MVGYKSHVRRYFRFLPMELRDLLITAALGGFIFSFRLWGGETADLGVGAGNLVLYAVFTFLVLGLQLLVTKLIGVRYGIEVVYEKYVLGLLVGVFLSFLTFGFVPFFITGRFNYVTIPNLRVGKFRSKLVKNWEAAMISLSGIMAAIFLTIPLHFLLLVTGAELFRGLIVVAVALAVLMMLPLPLIETANPYTVYMSRLESLHGNTPGFDLFFGSRLWWTFTAVMTVVFAVLALTLGPSPFALLVSVVLGLGGMFLYTRVRLHFAPR